ncbi:FadR/GntR family transcriptional regulator [Guptibacillus hwajinpoensis]|uniref:Uncharacterized protein n=2 Tax=Guptibacillus hwajinpoensis TaxID=208199 RepID=A0A0J6CVQ5_9BACL|nr:MULTISPECIES: FCD domain-containing protein [Alkalihalobacillus]KMM37243.1 hypothetical protein AB986_15370 [Alkalihalobacillus macyae]MDQ0481126.1 DNA-binding FadR family transcriptional regulator [Alkalihalobacillus hemicentroti]
MSQENSATEKVYEYIMEKIVSNEWKSKTRITSEIQLASDLNVSRISVRHALEKLVALGILEKKRGSGTVVNEIKPSMLLKNLVPIITLSENDVKDILEFRIQFEYGNIKMFMKNCGQEEINKLKNHYEDMKLNYDNPEKYYLYDFYFHQEIAIGTKNPIVISINEILQSILKYNMKQLYHDVGPDIALHYHEQILKAIEKGDTEMASLLMVRHLEEALENLVE